MPAMPATDSTTSAAPPPGAASTAGLVVRPFRGLRYDPARVSDLAAVTSPPYDVIDADSAVHLAELDPHNVVRLILPRPSDAAPGGEDGDRVGAAVGVGTDSGGGPSRYLPSRAALDAWLAEGVLVRDREPTIYVYEQSAPGLVQRGLLATVELRDPADRVVLPHEDVMPGPVEDRLDLMRTTSANLEPILLVYDGGKDTARVIDEVCAGEPLVETSAEDGLLQRLWAITDPATQDRVARDLAPRQALIADGHHRYATYRRLQAEHQAAGDGRGDWDLGLAMLVDSTTHPLRVQAIHRVVGGLGFADALARLGSVFRVDDAGGDLETALGRLQAAAGRHPFVLTDGGSFALLDEPAAAEVEAAMPSGEHSPDWRELDASVLHGLILDRLWAVDDAGGRTAYLHDAPSAVRAAQRADGVAVLMRPVTVDVVRTLAARGERMPRKSTSFGPKPRTGLVLRLLDR